LVSFTTMQIRRDRDNRRHKCSSRHMRDHEAAGGRRLGVGFAGFEKLPLDSDMASSTCRTTNPTFPFAGTLFSPWVSSKFSTWRMILVTPRHVRDSKKYALLPSRPPRSRRVSTRRRPSCSKSRIKWSASCGLGACKFCREHSLSREPGCIH
jgi:hypothetical protein